MGKFDLKIKKKISVSGTLSDDLVKYF